MRYGRSGIALLLTCWPQASLSLTLVPEVRYTVLASGDKSRAEAERLQGQPLRFAGMAAGVWGKALLHAALTRLGRQG
jgi:hypothetical protein